MAHLIIDDFMTYLHPLTGLFRDELNNLHPLGGYLSRNGKDITGKVTDKLGDSDIRGTLDFPGELFEFERKLYSGEVINYRFNRMEGPLFEGTPWVGAYSRSDGVSRPVIASTGLVFPLNRETLSKLRVT